MASNDIPTRVSKPQWVVEAIRISVEGLRVVCVLYNYVGGEHAADERVVQAAVHVDEPKVVVVLVHGAAKLFSGCKVTKIYFFIAIYFTQ